MNEGDEKLRKANIAAGTYGGEHGDLLFVIEQWLAESAANPSATFSQFIRESALAYAADVAEEAAINCDHKTLRDLADILEGKPPRRRQPLTPSQRKVVHALQKFRFEYKRFPDSQKELLGFSKRLGIQVSPSTLSDFPLPLPVGKGKPGRKSTN